MILELILIKQKYLKKKRSKGFVQIYFCCEKKKIKINLKIILTLKEIVSMFNKKFDKQSFKSIIYNFNQSLHKKKLFQKN